MLNKYILVAALLSMCACQKSTEQSPITLDNALTGSGGKTWKLNSCYTSVFMFDSVVVFNTDHTYYPIPIMGISPHGYNRTWYAPTDQMLVARYYDSTYGSGPLTDTYYISSFSAKTIVFDTMNNSFFQSCHCSPQWDLN